MMKKTIATACALATAAMGFSGAAFAQGRGHDRAQERHEQREEMRDARRDQRFEQRVDRHNRGTAVVTAPSYTYSTRVQPTYQYRSYSTAPRYYSYTSAPSYYGYAPRWSVGSYYSGPRYVVSNWGAYPGLYSPPYGYQWVQSDTGEFLLVAIATGIIANLLLHSRY